MIHYGDIAKLNGAELPIVDIITGGSPCQDLSIAGPRSGISGSRSGLFLHQIRIIKEMREHDKKANGRDDRTARPRICIWENVVGSLSSNSGHDFQTVLTEFIRIADPEAPDVPMPKKKWGKSGCLYDEMGKWSLAWRIHNSQFWGTPQRRRRVSLVVDFGGMSAPEILFEREMCNGNNQESGSKDKTAS